MFELPALPYSEDALEPHLDSETLHIHYSKHHQGYVTKLNAAIEAAGEVGQGSLDDIIKAANTLPAGVKNNGGGVWNHTFYWNCMAADKNTPSSEMIAQIEKNFGSMDSFKEQFLGASATVFGSGWGWLVKDASGDLRIMTTANQDHPWQTNETLTPILTCDVWEHAYYLKYRNLRADYLEHFWQVINWENVEKHWSEGYSHGA